MSKRSVSYLLLGIVLVGVAEWDLHKRVLAPIRKLDRFWVDFCIGNAGNRIKDPAITMVRITDDYEPVPIGKVSEAQAPDGAKALTRLDYAAFVYSIGKMNPKAVSLMASPVFAEKTVLNETDIYPLKDAVLQLPKMTLGTVVASTGDPSGTAESVQYPPLQLKGDPQNLPVIARTVRPADPDFLANGEPAFYHNDSHNPLEGGSPRIALVARQGDNVVAGFALASVARQAGVSADQITVDLESARPRIRVGELYSIPIASDGTMELPSHGGLSHAMYDVSKTDDGKEKRSYHFASLKVEDVALAAEQTDEVARQLFNEFSGKFESLANNLVLLGFDRSSDRTITTANDEWLSPMTATARAIATIQSGRHTSRWPLWVRGIVYGAFVVLGLVLLNMRRRAFPLILGLIVVSLVAMVLVFRQTLTWTPPTPILALLGLLLVLGLFSSGKKKEASTEEEENPAADAGGLTAV